MTTSSLSLREKIGQLIVVRTTGYLFDHQIRYPAWEANQTQLKKWLGELNIGGVILLGGSCPEIALRTQQLQSWAKTPLLICADIEEGVGQRFSGASWFPPPMALSQVALQNSSLALEYAQQMGKVTAEEALAIGINWILAPIVDVNNNPLNPVINVRAFSDEPETVAQLANSFIKGCQDLPILTTAKHFPGHGDTATDSHLDLPCLTHDLDRLQKIELYPFQQAINQQVDVVMTAHLLVKVLDENNPATLSYRILTEQLREKMGFEGLIVTDALIMGGVAKYASTGEIVVRALQAGADILLMPEDPQVAIDSIVEAVKAGIISSDRIDASLQRMKKAKEKLITTNNSVENSLQPLPLELISTEKSQTLIKNICRDSLQKQGDLPLKSVISGINLIVIDDFLTCDFLDRQTPAVTIPQNYGYQTQILESKNLNLLTYHNQEILLQVFVRGNPFRGSAGIDSPMKTQYQKLLENNQIQGLVVYGSPYIADWFKQQVRAQTPWLFSYGQMSPSQQIVGESLFNFSGEQDFVKGDFL